jgi:uncharacterized protein (TIGR02284 family)
MPERTELSVLDHLLATCRDGEHGLQFAADHATDPAVKALFASLAEERRRFADELTPHVHRLGGQGTSAGTKAGAIHRGWMNLRETVTRHHDEVLLAEAERGERGAMHAYEEALHGMLPPTASDLIERQHATIREAHTRIASLINTRELGAKPASVD